MPSINGTEYLVILVVALLVFGPQRLPEIATKVGGWLREIRSVANDFRVALEAEVGDLRAPLEEVTGPLKDLKDDAKSMSASAGEMLEWKGPVHDQGPTPEDAKEDFEALNESETEASGESDESDRADEQ